MKSPTTKNAPKYYGNLIGTCAHLTWPLESSIAHQMYGKEVASDCRLEGENQSKYISSPILVSRF